MSETLRDLVVSLSLEAAKSTVQRLGTVMASLSQMPKRVPLVEEEPWRSSDDLLGLHHGFHRLRHDHWRVPKCAAAECAEDDHLVLFASCNFQHLVHPLFMQGLKFFPTDMHSSISMDVR